MLTSADKMIFVLNTMLYQSCKIFPGILKN